MSPELPEIQRTTISGVPTFFVDSPPPHTATLFFRVGAWDETVLTRGITHLAEHLALFPFRDSETAHNGFVLGTITGIVASGSQGEVGEFFKDFTSGLSNVPTDRMEKEAGVLLAESMRIAKGNLHLLLGIEFGLAGPGLESQPERGLWRTEELGVHDWIEKYFTRDNVVLVVSGGPPDQIELDLPEGERSVYVMPEDGLGYRPTTMETAGFQESGICIAGVVDRSVAMTVAVAVAGARLNDRLRHDLGIVYTPAVAYDPIDKDHAHVFVGADAQAPNLKLLGTVFLDTVTSLAKNGATDVEIARHVKGFSRAAENDPLGWALNDMGRLALAELQGHEARPWYDYEEEHHALTPADIKSAWSAYLDRSLIVPPHGADLGLPPARHERAPTYLEGATIPFTGKGFGIPPFRIGPGGISLRSDDWLNITWQDLALAERRSDTEWWFGARNGRWIHFDVRSYRRAKKLTSAILRFTPPDVIDTPPID